ncbi:uncharacterized protein LACBIDRAFT_327388, partial [Laccaria bicolor S238N-H82]
FFTTRKSIKIVTVYIDTRRCVTIFDPHTLCRGSCDCKIDLNDGGTLTEWNDHDDLTSPSVFPYALASVCKQWYDLMLLVPEFWTRLVVFVDSQPTSTTDLRAQLSASRDRTKRLALCKISHLSSIDVPDLTFFNFLSVLGRFKSSMISLELNHVDLPTLPDEDLPNDWDFRFDFSSLHLEGLKKETFQEFGHFTSTSPYLESQTIRACELTDYGIGHSYYLDVQDINNTEELLSVVPTLSGRCVSFVSCGGLNDAVLERLSVPDPDTGEWGLENLKDLSILNSPEISVQGLKRLVKSRIVEASARGYGKDPDYDVFDQMAPIASLYISRCVDFSAVDVRWFKSKVFNM